MKEANREVLDQGSGLGGLLDVGGVAGVLDLGGPSAREGGVGDSPPEDR